MDKPVHELICPICHCSVATWRKGDCTFHHYFHKNRDKHETDKELAEAFFKEHPDMKGRQLDGQSVK